MCNGKELSNLASWAYFPKIYPTYKRKIANKYLVDEKNIYDQKIVSKACPKCKKYNKQSNNRGGNL